MTCEVCQLACYDLLDRRLCAKDEEEVLAHIEGCPACRAFLEEEGERTRSWPRLLGVAARGTPMPSDAAERVAHALEVSRERSVRQSLNSGWVRRPRGSRSAEAGGRKAERGGLARAWWKVAAAAAVVAATVWVVRRSEELASFAQATAARGVRSGGEAHGPVALVRGEGMAGLELPERLPGKVRVEEGLAVVRLGSGVELTLQGPLELEVRDVMSVRLAGGRMLARVPSVASGFTVRTRELEIWDIGTVFSVSAEEGGSDVFVFKGSVQVNEASGEPVDLCGAGEGVRLAGGDSPMKYEVASEEGRRLFEQVKGCVALKNPERAWQAGREIADLWAGRYGVRSVLAAENMPEGDGVRKSGKPQRRGSVAAATKTGGANAASPGKEQEMTTKSTLSAVLAAGVVAATGAQAEELYYSATGPGYYPWDNVAGWIIYNSGGTPYGQLPTINDNVRINATTLAAENGSALTVTNGFFAECNLFAAGDQNAPGTAWFRLDGGSLTCATHFVAGRYYPGLATLESGSVFCMSGGNFYIGSQSGGYGTVTNNGASVEADQFIVANNTAAFPSLLVQNGGSMTCRTDFIVGNCGEASAIFNGGNLSIGINLYAGRYIGSRGTIVNNGMAINASNIYAGAESGGFGRLEHHGGSFGATSQLQIGRSGGVGEFEADAPFSAAQMIIGTGLAPNVPGTGTVTMAEGAVGAVGEYLRINNGDLFLRGGQIHLRNVGNPSNPPRTNLYVRTGADRRGQLRGWGYVGYTNENITLRMINNGQIIADGDGVERDLDFNMVAVVNNDIPNGAGDTNGWYAVNKGRLIFPCSMTVSFVANTPTSACSGDLHNKAVPEMVNSIRATMTYSSNGSRAIRGGICALDRSDIPSGLPTHLRPVGIWFVGSFNTDKLAPSKVSFINAAMTFRYDHTKVKDTDSSLRLYRYDGSAWVRVGSVQPGGMPLISTDGTLAPLASGDYNIGWFAAMAVERKGTMISVH